MRHRICPHVSAQGSTSAGSLRRNVATALMETPFGSGVRRLVAALGFLRLLSYLAAPALERPRDLARQRLNQTGDGRTHAKAQRRKRCLCDFAPCMSNLEIWLC